MFRIHQILDHEWKHVACGLVVSALSGLALLAASAEAEAGYSCARNSTQIGNSIVSEVVATSGGSLARCIQTHSVGTGPSSISISGALVSAQVGGTVDTVYSRAIAVPQGLPPNFAVICTHPTAGGPCTSSDSGFIDGVDFVVCTIDGQLSLPIPNPALPLVPVVVTTVCTINY